MMRPTALLINTSRGPIVDRTALVDALRAKRIAGAGLDVFDKEPALDDPLVKLDNVVVTPHLGYVTGDVLRAFYGQTLENILAYLQNGRPDRILNPEVLGKTRR
jgi:26S proteasome regulatory subunit N2